MKKSVVISRRQLLHGTGGFTLGLPFLPSLIPIKAYAADVAPVRQPAFVAMLNFNGGAFDTHTFPLDTMLTESADMVPGHTIRRGKLVRAVEDSDAYLSPILGAPASELTERIVGKMNVLRGLDMPFSLGHSVGGFLGNPFGVPTGCGTQDPKRMSPFPTIDAFMAWSPTFYKNLAGVRQRILCTGNQYCGSTYFYANPTTRTGPIQKLEQVSDPVKLFNSVFTGASNTPALAPGRPPVVDRVLDSYRLMRNGSRRLSPQDRVRLDDHMSRLAELQRQLTVKVSSTAGCKDVKVATAGSTYQRQNDVIAAAFLCGYSRLATMQLSEHLFSSKKWDSGIWHNSITHSWSRPDAQAFIAEAHWNLFRKQFLDLVRKLDVEESPGVTVLDNALVMWSQECSQVTHNQTNIPVILAGGAGGALRTGNYCDYRNRTPKATTRSYAGPVGQTYTGLTWNRLLGTIVQAMGVPRSEYEPAGTYGYGEQHREADYVKTQAPGAWEQSGDILPFLKP